LGRFSEDALPEEVAKPQDEERLVTVGGDDEAKVTVAEPTVKPPEPAAPCFDFERARTDDEVASPAGRRTRERHPPAFEPARSDESAHLCLRAIALTARTDSTHRVIAFDGGRC